jgi:gliding motility-associated-like protein
MVLAEFIEPDCFGEHNGRIRLEVEGGHIPYRYSLNGGEFGGSSTFIALGAGIYGLQVRDAVGCIISLMDTLQQPPAVTVLLPADTTIVLGDSLLISAIVSNVIGVGTYNWSNAYIDSITCIDQLLCEAIFVKPALSNIYRLTVTDDNGCTGRDEIEVKVLKPHGVFVPTAFSPNGDQINDLLTVHGLSRQVDKILIFRIFDRWGEMIYEDRDFKVNDLSRGWDGRFRDEFCDPGVFVWLLEAQYVDGYRETRQGEVTLIR